MIISSKSLNIYSIILSVTITLACSGNKPIAGDTGAAESAAVMSEEEKAAVEEAKNEVEQKGADASGTPTPPSSPAPSLGNSAIEKLSSGYGILNFRQISATLTALTGVTMNAAAPAGGVSPAVEYAKAVSGLPADNTLAAISGGKVAALTKLASTYCDVLGNDAARLSARFPGLDIGAVPANSPAFAKTLLDGFYGPETALQASRAADTAAVAAAVDSFKALPGASGRAIFMATCAGILASAEFFVF